MKYTSSLFKGVRLSLLRGNIHLTNGNRGHYPQGPHHKHEQLDYLITPDNYLMCYHDYTIYNNSVLIRHLLPYVIMVVIIVFCIEIIVAEGL